MIRSLRRVCVTVLILSGSVLASSYGLPELGKSERQHFSKDQETLAGHLFLDIVNAQSNRLRDPLLVQYIADIGNQIVSANAIKNRSFQFLLIADPSINAFAGPNGKIGLHTGLITSAETEEEVASVIAHEIAHVTQNHLARRIEYFEENKWLALSATAAAVIAGIYSNNAQISAAGILASGSKFREQLLRNSRDFEREADRKGIHYLHTAGYVSRAMPSFFEKLISHEGTLSSYEFLRTHPLTRDRLDTAYHLSKQHPLLPFRESITFSLAKARIAFLMGYDVGKATDFGSEYFHALVAFSQDDSSMDQWVKDNRNKHLFIESLAIEHELRTDIRKAKQSIKQLINLYPNHLIGYYFQGKLCPKDQTTLAFLKHGAFSASDPVLVLKLISDCYAARKHRLNSLYYAGLGRKLKGRFNEAEYLLTEVATQHSNIAIKQSALKHLAELEQWKKIK